MAEMRKTSFVNDEFYHVYNRGVDKRDIFLDRFDLDRFMVSMGEFNVWEPIGSIWENQSKKDAALNPRNSALVRIICFCLNKNHFHLIIQQLIDGGISKFLHRLGMGYSKYFNAKYQRSGALFQGAFKAVPIFDDEQLLELSVYVNLNNFIHRLGHRVSKTEDELSFSSWPSFLNPKASLFPDLCSPSTILKHFKKPSTYKHFAESLAQELIERKKEERELSVLTLESNDEI